jgi:hypothetical protein
MNNKFYNKYNHPFLEDAGCYVSEEYKQFQKDLYKEMKGIAKNIGAEVVSKNHGHYFESYFFKRDNHYVYLHHEAVGYRTEIDLDSYNDFYIRTAANEKDFRGGSNCTTCYKNFANDIDRLLNIEHRQV